MKLPDYAFEDRELWGAALVRNAMVLALRVMRAVPDRIGPRKLVALSLETDGETDEWPEEVERFKPNRDDITHMEYVLVGYPDKNGSPRPAWLNGAILGYPEHRRILSRWSVWASFGKRGRDGVSQTEDEFARDLRVSADTMQRHRDFAANVIAQGLNEAGLDVWHVEKPKRTNNRHAGASS
jgi:hypothetical protein